MKTKSLVIFLNNSEGWNIYPPISAVQQRVESFPHKKLPDEIGNLTNLNNLHLIGLNLHNLPANFGELENLNALELSMNKLTISEEIDKLAKLENLTYLGLIGNKINATDLAYLRKALPNTEIISNLTLNSK